MSLAIFSGDVPFVYSTANGGFFILAATALCCFDHIITLDVEIKYIWRRRVSGASVLFILNRYSLLAASLASMVQFLPFQTVNHDAKLDAICSVSVCFVDACLVLGNTSYVVFAALRMFALYGMSKSILLGVLLLGLLGPFAQILFLASQSIGVSSTGAPVGIPGPRTPLGRVNCYHSIPSTITYGYGEYTTSFPVVRCHALIFEGVLIGLTWRGTLTTWRAQTAEFRAPLTNVLFRDGTLYFVIVTAISATNMIAMMIGWSKSYVEIQNDTGLLSLMYLSPMVDTLISICMSRFILSLLAITLGTSSSLQSSQQKTLRFATAVERIASQLGGSLDDSRRAGGEVVVDGEAVDISLEDITFEPDS